LQNGSNSHQVFLRKYARDNGELFCNFELKLGILFFWSFSEKKCFNFFERRLKRKPVKHWWESWPTIFWSFSYQIWANVNFYIYIFSIYLDFHILPVFLVHCILKLETYLCLLDFFRIRSSSDFASFIHCIFKQLDNAIKRNVVKIFKLKKLIFIFIF
jgi:hypothetical protein